MDKTDKTVWINKLWDPLEKMDSSPLHSKREGIKVAAYCRVSPNPRGVPESLMNQVGQYTYRIAGESNWKFVGVYFDNQVSARTANQRRGFSRMLRHCEEGKIDLILVKSVSRFSRNTKELIEIIDRLSSINVTVHFEAENITTTRSDTTFLLKTYAALAQGESEELSNIIEWGHEKQFTKGIPLLGNLYGYERVREDGDRVIKIVEEEAKIIREIFQMYLDGKSYTEISNVLTERRIKTKFGKDIWSSLGIKSILTNISYTGNYQARNKKRDLFTNKYRDSRGVRDQYHIKDSHPGIIGLDTFVSVQKQIANRGIRKVNQSPHKFTSLTGRVMCGNCGRNYVIIDRPPKPRRQCPINKKNHILCPSPILRECHIREMLLSGIKERFILKERSDIQNMRKLLSRINDNDHFEFHRLKAITHIDLAKKMQGTQYSSEDIKELEKSYKAFEEKLIKIEDDRKYRIEALQWIKNIQSPDDFIELVTIDHLRAWIIEIHVYSRKDYLIRFIDGKEVEIGKCEAAKLINSEEEIQRGHKAAVPYQEPGKSDDTQKGTGSEASSQIAADILPLKNEIIKEGDHLEVVKIMSTQPSRLLETVKKNIHHMGPIDMNLPVDPNKKVRVAAYVRVSTDSDEQLNSFKTQLAFYSFYILNQPNYEFVGVYADEGVSGTSTKKRDQFNKLIKDCKAGKIDLIITKSISRFARNTVDLLYYTRMLSSLDPPVYIQFERENILTKDIRSQVLITLLGTLSQEESVGLAHSVSWGKKNLASRGIVRPGALSYGYRYGKDNEWIIIEEEAAVVQRIYQDFLNGKSKRKIAHELTSEGVKTPEGQKNWSFATIDRILNSEKYNGDYLYQRYYSTLTVDSKSKRNKGEKPMFLIEGHHRPIIDKELWDQVQKKIGDRKKQNSKKEVPNTFGKNKAFIKHLKCGKCGSTVTYSKNASKPYVYHNWRCVEGYRGFCKVIGFQQEYLEENFSQLLLDMKFNPDFKEVVEQLRERLKLSDTEKKERECIHQEINEITQQLHQAVNEQLGKVGKDAKKVEFLTEEILKRREQLLAFDDREEQLELVEKQFNYVEKTLKNYTDPKTDEHGFYIKNPPFFEDAFKELIVEGVLHENGKVTYKLSMGIEWSAPINYDDLKRRREMLEKRKREAEKEKQLNSPKVKAMIEYCKEPKNIHELHEFFNQYKYPQGLKRSIVNPLIERGIIKMTMPDKPSSSYQRYYSVSID